MEPSGDISAARGSMARTMRLRGRSVDGRFPSGLACVSFLFDAGVCIQVEESWSTLFHPPRLEFLQLFFGGVLMQARVHVVQLVPARPDDRQGAMFGAFHVPTHHVVATSQRTRLHPRTQLLFHFGRHVHLLARGSRASLLPFVDSRVRRTRTSLAVASFAAVLLVCTAPTRPRHVDVPRRAGRRAASVEGGRGGARCALGGCGRGRFVVRLSSTRRGVAGGRAFRRRCRRRRLHRSRVVLRRDL